ncbi:MAG: hypothetical protein ABIW82_17755 [Dokdonella sp.]
MSADLDALFRQGSVRHIIQATFVDDVRVGVDEFIFANLFEQPAMACPSL